MAIYIGTILAGRNGGKPYHVTKWNDKADFFYYCDHLTALTDSNVNQSMSIAELCDAIADKGIGSGSRWHKRITRQETIQAGYIPDRL